MRVGLPGISQLRKGDHGLVEGHIDIRSLHLHRQLPFRAIGRYCQGIIGLNRRKKIVSFGLGLVIDNPPFPAQGRLLQPQLQCLTRSPAFNRGGKAYFGIRSAAGNGDCKEYG